MKAEHDWIASSPDDLKAFNITATSDAFALDRVKVEVYRATQIYYAAMDSLSLCMFIFGPGNILSYDDIVTMVNAATGFDYSFDDLMQIGEQAIQLQRKIYCDFGGTDEELLPYMETPIPDGPTEGNRISREDFTTARRTLLHLMGMGCRRQAMREPGKLGYIIADAGSFMNGVNDPTYLKGARHNEKTRIY